MRIEGSCGEIVTFYFKLCDATIFESRDACLTIVTFNSVCTTTESGPSGHHDELNLGYVTDLKVYRNLSIWNICLALNSKIRLTTSNFKI